MEIRLKRKMNSPRKFMKKLNNRLVLRINKVHHMEQVLTIVIRAILEQPRVVIDRSIQIIQKKIIQYVRNSEILIYFLTAGTITKPRMIIARNRTHMKNVRKRFQRHQTRNLRIKNFLNIKWRQKFIEFKNE